MEIMDPQTFDLLKILATVPAGEMGATEIAALFHGMGMNDFRVDSLSKYCQTGTLSPVSSYGSGKGIRNRYSSQDLLWITTLHVIGQGLDLRKVPLGKFSRGVDDRKGSVTAWADRLIRECRLIQKAGTLFARQAMAEGRDHEGKRIRLFRHQVSQVEDHEGRNGERVGWIKSVLSVSWGPGKDLKMEIVGYGQGPKIGHVDERLVTLEVPLFELGRPLFFALAAEWT